MALSLAITLAGYGNTDNTASSTRSNNTSGNMSNTGGNITPTAPAAKLGIEGPGDPIQHVLSDQLFGALIDGAAPADDASPLPAVRRWIFRYLSIR